MKTIVAAAFSVLLAAAAFGNCWSRTVIIYQTAEWSDGSITTQILGVEEYMYCDTSADPIGPPPGSGGGGGTRPGTTPPTVSLAWIDTTDPQNPIVAVDVTQNDPADAVNSVILDVSGMTQDYLGASGSGRYQLHFPSVENYGGSVGFAGRACTNAGICGQAYGTMTRFTPSPDQASENINASWQEEEERGPVTRFTSYNHVLRQMYTTTSFSCPERGEGSHIQLQDSLVTISGYDPLPWWSGSVATQGTINFASYGLSESANPVACTFPTVCSSKSGGSTGTFGYAPSVHESLSGLVIEGQNALTSGGSLDISF